MGPTTSTPDVSPSIRRWYKFSWKPMTYETVPVMQKSAHRSKVSALTASARSSIRVRTAARSANANNMQCVLYNKSRSHAE